MKIPRTITYNAQWSDGALANWQPDTYPGWCPDGFVDTVKLELIEVPGYHLEVCTTGARQYLQAIDSKIVSITFEVQYDLFELDSYRIPRIEDWIGNAIQRPGSGTCISYKPGERADGVINQCDGLEVRQKTKEVFRYGLP
jgi:hypothetical protein